MINLCYMYAMSVPQLVKMQTTSGYSLGSSRGLRNCFNVASSLGPRCSLFHDWCPSSRACHPCSLPSSLLRTPVCTFLPCRPLHESSSVKCWTARRWMRPARRWDSVPARLLIPPLPMVAYNREDLSLCSRKAQW